MAKFCGNCGASLNDSTSQCPYCGLNINSVNSKDTAPQKPQKRKKKKGLIVLVSFVCLCVISLIVVTSMVRNYSFDNVVSNLNEMDDVLKPTPKAPDVDSLLDQTFGESCQCGESAYWKLTDSGDTLVIYGTGALYEDNILEKNERKLSYQEQKLIKYIIVDEGIIKLSRQNFYSWEIDCLYLPSTLEEIDGAFYIFAQIGQIRLNSGNRFFALKDDILFNSDLTALVKYPTYKKASSYETPKTVREICADAFCGNNTLKKLVISEPTETIGENAFANMGSLKEIVISNSVKEIGESALFNNEKLEDVTLPSGIETVPQGMFNRCISLKSIVIPEGVDYISAFAFDGCDNLEKVVLPSTIRTLGALSFRDCTSLKEINLPEGLKYLGSNSGVFENDKGKVFENCTSIKEIIIPVSVEEIRWGVFSNWTESQTIYMRTDSPGSEWKEEWAEKCDAQIVWGYKG